MKARALPICLSVAAFGCGSPPAPAEPTLEPNSTEVSETSVDDNSPTAPTASEEGNGHSVYLGWFCKDGGHGRPAVRPLFARTEGWGASAEELERLLQSQSVKRFSVWSWAGGHAGSFAVTAAARDKGGAVAIGGYMGQSTCVLSEGASVTQSEADPACVRLSTECSLATAEIESSSGMEARPYDELPDLPEIRRSGACLVDDALWLDVDGDGRKEGFDIAQLLLEGPAPVELPLASSSVDHCEASFASSVSKEQALQLVAVLDADRDGRFELVFRRASGEFLIYGAPASPSRMELLGSTRLQLP